MDATSLDDSNVDKILSKMDGVIVPGGFGNGVLKER